MKAEVVWKGGGPSAMPSPRTGSWLKAAGLGWGEGGEGRLQGRRS